MDADKGGAETEGDGSHDVALKAAQWTFEHYVAQGKDVTRQITLSMGLYLLITIVAMFVNLGAIEAVSVEAGGITANLSSSWPVRLVLLFAATLTLALVVYLSVFLQRYGLLIAYFAEIGLPRAQMALGFEQWLARNHTVMNAVNMAAGIAIVVIVPSLYLGVIISFIMSLF